MRWGCSGRLTALGIATFLAFLPIAFRTITTSSDPSNLRRQNGNSNAASDLYGIGIRLGIYLQVLGMLLSCIRNHKRSLTGIKLLSSAVCVSLLLTWTVSVSQQQISACEAWLILSLINAYATPRSAAIKHWTKGDGGGIPFLFSLVSLIWQWVAFVWFFATLVFQLPSLGTKNLVWFFTAVNVSGWFRILMLVYSLICCILLPVEIICYLYIIVKAFCAWAKIKVEYGDEGDMYISESDERPRRRWTWNWLMQLIARASLYMMNNIVFKKINNWNYEWSKRMAYGSAKDLSQDEENTRWDRYKNREKKFWCFWGFFILLLTIVGVEKTIAYNQLSPATNIVLPGQIIPFMLGIITLVEGIASACMPTREPRGGRDTDTLAGSVVECGDLEAQRRNADQEWESQEARFQAASNNRWQQEEAEK